MQKGSHLFIYISKNSSQFGVLLFSSNSYKYFDISGEIATEKINKLERVLSPFE